MKLFSKLLVSGKVNPFLEIYALRGSIVADFRENVFYVTGETTQNSWGIGFELRNGYTAEKPAVTGLSTGIKDGITYWVSARTRPATLDYYFDVKKNGVVTDTYRITYII